LLRFFMLSIFLAIMLMACENNGVNPTTIGDGIQTAQPMSSVSALNVRVQTPVLLPPEVVKASEEFRKGWQTRHIDDYAVSRVLLPCLRIGMTKDAVRQLFGLPDGERDDWWSYTLFWSMYIDVRYGPEETVVQIDSPLLNESLNAEPNTTADGDE